MAQNEGMGRWVANHADDLESRNDRFLKAADGAFRRDRSREPRPMPKLEIN